MREATPLGFAALNPTYEACAAAFPPLPLGEDMQTWERSELAGVGEGFCPVNSTHPLSAPPPACPSPKDMARAQQAGVGVVRPAE